MKLFVPYVKELKSADARIVALASFLGASCETISISHDVNLGEEISVTSSPDQDAGLILNGCVLKEWVGEDGFPSDLISFILSRFARVIVHGLRPDDFDSRLVAALSNGNLQSVTAVGGTNPVYEIAYDSGHVCGPFAGLSFGPANPANDHVFHIKGSAPELQQLISISGLPFMAAVRLGGTEVLFVASEDVADLKAEVGEAPLTDYFSRLLPHAMAIRYAAGDECWRPSKPHAAIVIDDPLLRNNYGFLNFESLLRRAEEQNFHAAIAFIPHNFRRSSPRITQMFLENPGRLSICFHGNDHTEAEFASTETGALSTLLQTAEDRMKAHEEMTSLRCDRVMVFPQGNFSIEAMRVLRSHNFYAAVNTVPYPMGQEARLTIGELAQPAVLRYEGFPLFLRRPCRKTQKHDVAFNAFFGRPLLIVEHHEIFRRPESLLEVAAGINAVVPEVHWSNLTTVVSNSFLTRRESDGTFRVRPYSASVQVSNNSSLFKRYSIEWKAFCDRASLDQILEDETPYTEFEIDEVGVRVAAELPPHSTRRFSVAHRNVFATVKNLGLGWHAQAFIRRRLSEVRDNYLSKNQHLLRAAKTVREHLLH
jgi:hypothetical protein